MKKNCISVTKEKIYTIPAEYVGILGRLTASGKYAWVHPELDTNEFQTYWYMYLDKRKDVQAKLVTMREDIAHNRKSLDSNLKLIAPGYHAGSLHHLLFFGIKYPDIQLKFQIISTWPVYGWCYRGEEFDYFLQYYARLTSNGRGLRMLNVISYNNSDLFSKDSEYHFLVVENEKD